MVKINHALLNVQKAWWDSHEAWWVHPPFPMNPGDVGTLEGVQWRPMSDDFPDAPISEGWQSLNAGPVTKYTHSTMSSQVTMEGNSGPLLSLTLGGLAVEGSAGARAENKKIAGAVISAPNSEEQTLTDFHAVKQKMKNLATAKKWDPEWLVVSDVFQSLASQDRSYVTERGQKLAVGFSANAPLTASGGISMAHATSISGGLSAHYSEVNPINVKFLGANRAFWGWKISIRSLGKKQSKFLAAFWNVPHPELEKVPPGEMFIEYTWEQMQEILDDRRNAMINAGAMGIGVVAGLAGVIRATVDRGKSSSRGPFERG